MKEILDETEGECVYKHDTGEISQVKVDVAGMGKKGYEYSGCRSELGRQRYVKV